MGFMNLMIEPGWKWVQNLRIQRLAWPSSAVIGHSLYSELMDSRGI